MSMQFSVQEPHNKENRVDFLDNGIDSGCVHHVLHIVHIICEAVIN